MNRPAPHLTPRHRPDDDRGAVAIIAALTVVLLLIPVAAMAADLGAVYVSEGGLQQVADVAAKAGAAELAAGQRDNPAPSAVMAAAREKAVQALCAGVAAESRWGTACTGPYPWAADGNPANGEVSFYTGAPSSDGGFPAPQGAAAAGPQDWVTGVRVVTPPLRVTFGLAAAFTTDHTDLQRAATAGIFTVLPWYGFFPMYLAAGEYGGFCTRSAPRAIWQSTHPSGCTSVARGYLAAARTKSSENTNPQTATTWNTAIGFDAEHQPLPGLTATLAPNYYNNIFFSTSALVRDLTSGLFVGPPGGGKAGRLKSGTCRGTYSTTSGPYSGVENAYLTDFLDLRIGDRAAFRTAVRSPSATPSNQRGWLDPDVLRCGRLAVVPALTTIANPPPLNGLTTLTYNVGSLRLVWLDDRLWDTDSTPVASGSCLERGFYWADPDYSWICRNDLRAYTGYILDPRLLPATVAGPDAANALDHFIGAGMPATTRLIRDAADPPAR